MNDTGTQPFAEWIGRVSEATDVVAERLVESYRATLDPHLAPVGEGIAPLGLHWCLSPAIADMDQLGADGHPAKNRDVPPVPQPRRMWAGGWLETHGWLRIGDVVKRVTTIADITKKRGRSGELWFVSVDHAYVVDGEAVIRERHNIVYREASRLDARKPSSPAGERPRRTRGHTWNVATTPTLLFRYSAISFNGHRIHYDQPYATEVEGYRGLVVHGPVMATLLLNLAAVETGAPPGRFTYRGLAPAICGEPLEICAGAGGDAGSYWVEGPDGVIRMEAQASNA